MKRSIFICSVCFTMVALSSPAQNKKNSKQPPPPPPLALLAVPPAPPIPPSPPAPPSEKIKGLPSVPAIPEVPAVPPGDAPLAPLPPDPLILPAPPSKEGDWVSRDIINEKGNEVSIRKWKNDDMVYISKNGKVEIIKLSTWNANRKAYEKKYGMLPPPPPPPVPVD